MAASSRARVRLSEASQAFLNDDADARASGEYSAEDSTSEKVKYIFLKVKCSNFVLSQICQTRKLLNNLLLQSRLFPFVSVSLRGK